jgi:GNAT superfamily N-acetyltransferase
VNEITFQEEGFDAVDEHFFDLFQQHYEEIAWRKDKIKLNPDMEKYKLLADQGLAKMYTARENGELIGYAIWFIVRHMHYKNTLKAMNDILYVAPEKRGGMLGVNLIRHCENELIRLGVHTIGMHIKKSLDWGYIAERMGFEPVETLYEKYVGG